MATKHPDPDERGGTWGSREAAAEWIRGAAARADAFGPATERMLDLANVNGDVDRTFDFYDYGANIVITLPPCK